MDLDAFLTHVCRNPDDFLEVFLSTESDDLRIAMIDQLRKSDKPIRQKFVTNKAGYEALQKAHASGSSKVQCALVQFWGNHEPKFSKHVLKAFENKDDNDAHRAASTIGGSDLTTLYDKHLIKLLDHKLPHTRRAAIIALSEKSVSRNQHRLKKLALNDPKESVRHVATVRLVKQNLPSEGGDISDLLPAASEVLATGDTWLCYEISSIGPAAASVIPALISVLKDKKRRGDYDVMTAFAQALAAMGPAAKDASPLMVRQIINGGGILVPNSARYALSCFGRSAVPAILRGLKSPRAGEYAIPRLALVLKDIKAEPQSTAPVLRALSKSKNPHLRTWSLIALAYIAPDSEILLDTLTKAAKNDKKPYTQWHAILALGLLRTNSQKTISALTQILKRLIPQRIARKNAKNKSTRAELNRFIKSEETPENIVDSVLAIHISLLRLERNREWLSGIECIFSKPDKYDIDLVIEAVRATGEFGKAAPRITSKIDNLLHSSEDKNIRSAAAEALERLK